MFFISGTLPPCKHTKKKHSIYIIDSFFDKINLKFIKYRYFNNFSFTFALNIA